MGAGLRNAADWDPPLRGEDEGCSTPEVDDEKVSEGTSERPRSCRNEARLDSEKAIDVIKENTPEEQQSTQPHRINEWGGRGWLKKAPQIEVSAKALVTALRAAALSLATSPLRGLFQMANQ